MEKGRLTAGERARVWGRLGIRLAAIGVGWFLVRRFGRLALELTAPFLLAWGVAAALEPLVERLRGRLGLPRSTAAPVVVLGLLALVGGGAFLILWYAARELVGLAKNWEVVFDAFQGGLDRVELMFAHLFAAVPPELTAALDTAINAALLWMEQAIPALLKWVGDRAAEWVMALPSFLFSTLFFVLGTWFAAAEYPRLRGELGRRMGEGVCRFGAQMRGVILTAFGGYLRAQVLLSAGVFCILLLGFLATGQGYSVVLAIGLAVLDFIPLLGAGTVMVPWAVFALLSRSYPQSVSVMVIWGIVTLYRRAAEPKIVGDSTGLSPVLSLFSIYAGTKLAGVPGMILGPIVTLVGVNLGRCGILEGVVRDLRAAARDILSLVKWEQREN